MADDGFHEIQLNGKQLVFTFMAVTVMAVVIFLCGVLVGRGVRAPQPVDAVATTSDAVVDPTEVVAPAPAAPSTAGGAAPSTQETLTYPERLEDSTPPPETLEDPPADAPPAKPAAKQRPAAPQPPSRSDTAPSEPAGTGFVVQVAAVRERGEADTIARRLASKGYPSFVSTPAGAARVFRVRVGKYTNRREAESVASRLKKEEQFKPWITR